MYNSEYFVKMNFSKKELINGIDITLKEERKWNINWNKSKIMKFYKEELISGIGITLPKEKKKKKKKNWKKLKKKISILKNKK